MADELGARERRYIEAYLELESQAATGSKSARERVIAAAFGEGDELDERWEVEVARPRRSSRPGVLIAAGMGLCAAMAVAWWAGRAALVEETAARRADQAPRVHDGAREVHEAATARRATGQPRTTASGGALEAEVQPGAPEGSAELDAHAEAGVDARPSADRKPTPPRKPRDDQALAEPATEPATPTLSTAEVELLDRARRLAQAGEHEAALARLREHASRYPTSELATERVAEEVAVLCRMGAATAESARASFLAGAPPQYLRSRVAKACAP